MALATHVTDRFGTNSDFLRGLTNQDDDDASTVNTTRLGKAATAAEGQFVIHAQKAYDDTDQAHIEAGVVGVIAYLRLWSSKQGSSEGALSDFRDTLAALAKTDTRKRIQPKKADPVEDADDDDLFAGLSPKTPKVGEST